MRIQGEVKAAQQDVTTKSSAAQQAAEQISADKAHIDRVVDNFDTISKTAINDIGNTTEEAKQLIVQTAVDETAKIQTMTSQWTSDTNAQIDRLNEDIITVRQEFASSVSAAQSAASEAARHEQAAQGYRNEAQTAADSVGDAIFPALLTTTAEGTGTVTMANTADYPLQALAITGATQQDGTPEPGSPIYPVSVGDGGTIDVKVCGQNLLDWEGAVNYSNWHTTALDDDHPYGYYPYLIVNGFVPGETYTIAADSIPELGAADVYCLLGTYPGANKGQTNWLYHKTADALCRPIRTFVADAYTYYLNCNGCKVDTVSQVVHDWLPNLRIYQGSYTADTIPPYEPYSGQTATIPVERPIMRIGDVADTINSLTGDGLQTWGKIEFDGSEQWIAPTGSYANYTYCVAITGKALGHQTSICSHHQNVNQAFSVNVGKPGMYCDHPSNTNVYFVSEKPTLDDFKSWLTEQKAAGAPVTLWYQLAQPTTYQVTPVSDFAATTA